MPEPLNETADLAGAALEPPRPPMCARDEESRDDALLSGAFLGDYAPVSGIFDECLSGPAQLRDAYRPFLEALSSANNGDWLRRNDVCRRIIHEQGITYNVYGAPQGMENPWQMDPLPMVLGGKEWRGIETALVQRATLLNRILADCYGAQDLIRSAWLPPALVFGQPDFLRPCHGAAVPDGVFLHFYAADLARSADGNWWVVSDRTQIPTGAGYALANRLIAARILPEPFRGCQVERLAGFFREVQAMLNRLAMRRSDQPRVVVLTPGPFNETYFEQAWLARYLGYSLVEGQDLTVRDDRVFLKTLAGLERVDVILRRVDDDWCDPLELRNDSMLGVPGLVRAVRGGHVSVANALGSSLLQSPAFMPFLPGLCRHLLGEELKLPSVATWWCGQQKAESYVLDHLEKLTLKPAFRPNSGNPEGEAKTGVGATAALRERIRFRPEGFVAQERLSFSTAPAWDGRNMVARPISLRVYLVATPDGYRAMPGGLTRVGAEPGDRFISLQRGGTSKDTWVLADGPIEEVTLLSPSNTAGDLRRVGNNLPSRLADNFFWLGRYAERADASARLLRSLLLRLGPEGAGGSIAALVPLTYTLRKQGQLPAPASPAESPLTIETMETEVLAAIFDAQRRGSLRGIAEELQRLAVLVRDRTSHDFWRVLNHLGGLLAPRPDDAPARLGDTPQLLNEVVLHLAALHGLARENMTRAQGWRFLDIGLRIERSIYLCTFLDSALRLEEADDPSVLETVLEAADSTLTYRSRYNLLPNIAAVYDLVLLDDTNPRSLLFQFNQLGKHFERLPRERESAVPSPGQRLLLEALMRLRLADPRSLAFERGQAGRNSVRKAVNRVLQALPGISDAIAVSYFAHSTISRTGRP